MWFVFPQISGLGSSAMSEKYSISSLEEGTAYSKHPILGPRLLECSRLVTDAPDGSLKQILGPTDSVIFWSSMTLFSHATVDNKVFEDAFHKYFSGRYDQQTIDRLGMLSTIGD
jgi:uncharacterized protein (DUF1810 family)